MKISVVATLFFSEPYIEEFYNRVISEIKKVTNEYEIIFVDDGSPDNSKNKILSLQVTDPKIVLIELSKNFGHHRAMLTGLNYTTGDYTFLIDTDLEEDPELFSVFWEELKKTPEFDVIYGIQRKRKGRFFERISGKIFYKLFHFISGYFYPSDTLTARIMNKNYLEGLKKFTEKEFDIWGLFILNGFKQRGIILNKKSKGSSTYTTLKKFRLAIISITSLTNRPLYFIFFLGLLITIIAAAGVLIIIYRKLVHNINVAGWASIFASVWLIGGIIMFTLGIIGIYLSKIYLEVKNRPSTIIKNIYKSDVTL
jgi:putative glycosyltransferase